MTQFRMRSNSSEKNCLKSACSEGTDVLAFSFIFEIEEAKAKEEEEEEEELPFGSPFWPSDGAVHCSLLIVL